MWSRRSVLAGAGVSLFSIGVAGTLRGPSSNGANHYVEDAAVDERVLDVDGDDRPERLVRVSFVPRRRLVAVRLEGRVVNATELELASDLDRDGDGWYAITRRVRLGREHRGETQFLHAPPSRRVPDYDDRWLVENRGFQPDSIGITDFRGFEEGDRLRLVAVPHGGEPTVVAEYVVGDQQ